MILVFSQDDEVSTSDCCGVETAFRDFSVWVDAAIGIPMDEMGDWRADVITDDFRVLERLFIQFNKLTERRKLAKKQSEKKE